MVSLQGIARELRDRGKEHKEMKDKSDLSPRTFQFEREGIQGLCEALEDDDPHLRQMAALMLGMAPDDRSVHALVAALGDTEKNVRARATDGLVALGSRAVPEVIPLLADSSWVVRYRAAEILGRIEDGRALEPLIGILGDEKDHVRYMAAKSLGIIGDRRATEPMLPLLHDENVYVRTSAARALGVFGGERAFLALSEALKTESNSEVIAALKNARK